MICGAALPLCKSLYGLCVTAGIHLLQQGSFGGLPGFLIIIEADEVDYITCTEDVARAKAVVQRADRSKIFGVNIKTIYAGGFRTTPIDAVQSTLQNQTIYYQKEAYTLSNPAYFRTDLRLSLKKERRHLTTILSLDLQNLTGRRNVYDQQYDIVKKKVVTIYQVGLIPVLNYKVEF